MKWVLQVGSQNVKNKSSNVKQNLVDSSLQNKKPANNDYAAK
jgi:hypothetical protein